MLKITIIGNLTDTAVARTTESGLEYVTFTVAVNKTTKDKTGAEDKTTVFVQCVKERSGVDQYLEKGKKVYAEGQLKVSQGRDGWGNPTPEIKARISEIQLL